MHVSTLRALGEPNRLRMVEILSEGPQPVGFLTERLAMPQVQASKHLRVLREAGLVSAEKRAQLRIYRLEAEPFVELGEWVERISQVWRDRLDALDVHLEELQGSSGTGEPGEDG